MMGIEIRPMREADLPRAVQIERICFTSEAWTEGVYREEFAHSGMRPGCGGMDPPYLWLWAAQEQETGEVVGTISLTRVGDDGEIGNVAVVPDYRRQGIAGRLLSEAIRFGGEIGLQAFTLEVRAGNTAARRLYESAGFREEGIRPRFYTQPVEDAVILWRRTGSAGR